jgi:hypothetical protein
MTKKKKIEKIYVKKPKKGEFYWFWFAGSITYGKLLKPCDKLTAHYGEPWFTLEDKRGTKYPVSIFKLRNVKPKYSENV